MNYSGCAKCRLPLFASDEQIKCDCCHSRKYHLECTSMNAYDLQRCLESDNLFWICDECLPTFSHHKVQNGLNDEKQATSTENNLELTVQQLQLELSEVKECISDIKQLVTNRPPKTSEENRIMPSTSTPRSKSNVRNISSLNRNHLHVGRNAQKASPFRSQTFWIFFTRIAKHVSCDDIRKMVIETLNLSDPPDVTRLVPQWSNFEDLRYVSFKVGFDMQYKAKALLETTWPAGWIFWEFVCHEPQYWEP